MRSTGSSFDASTVCVAPNPRAHSSFRGSVSTAMIVRAPTRLAPAIAASPTPPQPNTATVSSRCTPPVFTAAPKPAITPQPSRPAASGRAEGFTFVACPAATSVFAANAPMPSAGDSAVPSPSVMGCVALCVSKQYQGSPASARSALAAHGPPVEDDEVARRDARDVGTDGVDGPRGLVTEQVREVVADAAFAVVEVGVADTARLHRDERLTGARVGHDDGLDAYRLPLARRDDAAHLAGHTRGR